MSQTTASIFARLNVDLGERSYPIVIGTDLLTDIELIANLPGRQFAVVTNTVVAPLYLDRVSATLKAAGKQCIPIVLPDGEEEKNIDNLMAIFTALLEKKCDRKTSLLALGGGVIGDMTGFAAATYMRGVPYVQVPTTLLAQVDSSVGGKTAINHPLGKNMIGAFYQPQMVLADTATLSTLPDRELSAGLAEVIKHGAIIDAKFFDWLEQNIDALRARDAQALAYAIRRSCEIKAEVVRQDERESGLRAIFNFGHTFGHAIEAGLGYGEWLHGEAVGCGMVMAAHLSQRLGGVDAAFVQQLVDGIGDGAFAAAAAALGAGRYLELMRVDKKAEAGEIRFVVIDGPGRAAVRAAPDALVAQVIDRCCV